MFIISLEIQVGIMYEWPPYIFLIWLRMDIAWHSSAKSATWRNDLNVSYRTLQSWHEWPFTHYGVIWNKISATTGQILIFDDNKCRMTLFTGRSMKMHKQLCFKRLVINLLYISLLNLYFSQDLKSKVDLRVLYKTMCIFTA